jgi:hypothetical protein
MRSRDRNVIDEFGGRMPHGGFDSALVGNGVVGNGVVANGVVANGMHVRHRFIGRGNQGCRLRGVVGSRHDARPRLMDPRLRVYFEHRHCRPGDDCELP